MIEVQKIPPKGRGIIASQDIPKGTLIEAAPVGIIPLGKKPNKTDIKVFKYHFVPPGEYSNSTNVKRYLVFGLASLCNHAENSNACVDWIEDEIGLWSHFIAQKDINRGEEVTLFYTDIDEYADMEKIV
ncbi:MAG: SET domain-containing protein-lysine N-methyltransferase [Geitlerinemataceae cyanobacterium]